MTLPLDDDDAAVILQHLPRTFETTDVLNRLRTYLYGYEWDTSSAGSFEGGVFVNLYQRGKIIERVYYDPQEAAQQGVTEVDVEAAALQKLGHPEAVRRDRKRWRL